MQAAVKSQSPYTGKHANTQDEDLSVPYCMGGAPVAYATKSLLIPMGSEGWKACRDSFTSRHSAVEIGRCVYRNLHVGCNEGMSPELMNSLESRFKIVYGIDAEQSDDRTGTLLARSNWLLWPTPQASGTL